MDTPPPDDVPPEPPIVLPAVDLPPLGDAVVLQPAEPMPASPLPNRHTGFALAILGIGIAEVVMLALGGPVQQFAMTGIELSPLVLLSLFAYAGQRNDGLKIVTLVYWLLVIVGLAFLMLLMTIGVLLDPAVIETARRGAPVQPRSVILVPGGQARLIGAVVGLCLAVALGVAGFLPTVRRAASRRLPFDANSIVHAVALATVLGMSAVLLVPLGALAEAPALTLLEKFQEFLGPDLAEQMSDHQMLLAHVYFLVWVVPLCFVAVGYPLHRALPAAARRLGLIVPTVGQVAFGLAAAIGLAVLMTILEIGIHWLWTRLGWPQTDTKGFEKLIGFAINPVGAVVVGVVAGLGEELFARGVLQPRLGILLSNLFFTSLHAWQYNWDGLLSVFIIGFILGLIRRRTNTTTSAVVHGTYDCLLLLATFYGIDKWLGN